MTKPLDLIMFVVAMAMATVMLQLSIVNSDLRQRLDQSEAEPSSVMVTCVCPEYEEGWDDAVSAQGCDPGFDETPIEDLRLICAELDAFGYVPGC